MRRIAARPTRRGRDASVAKANDLAVRYVRFGRRSEQREHPRIAQELVDERLDLLPRRALLRGRSERADDVAAIEARRLQRQAARTQQLVCDCPLGVAAQCAE